MSFVFTDRESAYPNKYLVTPESGSPYYVILERADEPVVVGTPLNAETFNALIADLTAMAEDAGVPLPSTATVGQYIRVKAVDANGEVTETETASVMEDLPAVTSIGMVKGNDRIGIVCTLENGGSSVSQVYLDENDRPVSIDVDGVTVPITWEGFDSEV
jgi:hypothetical protein